MDVNITKRKRRRVQRDRSVKMQTRWVASYHLDGVRPDGKSTRIQRFFESKQEAIEFRSKLLSNAAPAKRTFTTVGDITQAWLASKRRTTRSNTFTTYEHRAKLLSPLFPLRFDKLATRDIRRWHDGIAGTGKIYSASKALGVLKSALALYAEDSGVRPIAMPNNLQRRQERPVRKHLSVEQVRAVVASGNLYVAFPFLAGTRISEQLGLCWDCVDFDANVIRIRRVQDKITGDLIECTKTAAGYRAIPMSATLRRMLLEWKPDCPVSMSASGSERVFPAPQGGTLLYLSFLRQFWKPALKRMGLPPVSIHSARASFISMLQASGVELAVAANLAGHKTPAVTLQYYTHALKGGEQAMKALDAVLS